MSQEQKAKAYDEAIRKIKGMMPNWELLSYNGKTFLQDLINIFPELTESEDEKIRKELIEHIKANSSSDFVLFQKFSPNDVLVWLEKQGTSYTKRDVDDAFEKEVREYVSKNCASMEEPDEFLTTVMQLDDMVIFAKHFYELGLKAQKGE